eukprot:Selendium_serpulae@DN5274_c0_g1_i4.p2
MDPYSGQSTYYAQAGPAAGTHSVGASHVSPQQFQPPLFARQYVASVQGQDPGATSAAASAAAAALQDLAFVDMGGHHTQTIASHGQPSHTRTNYSQPPSGGYSQKTHSAMRSVKGGVPVPLQTSGSHVFRKRQAGDSQSIWALYPDASKVNYKVYSDHENRPYTAGWTDDLIEN